MASARHWEQDKEATVYVGNLDERITDAMIWELMIQVGRVVNVHLPKDRVSQSHQGYGFVEFNSEVDAEYAAKVMNQVRLHGKPIRVNKASADKQKTVDIGAELFIGNLDTMADERTLYDTFSRFGTLITPPKVARDEMNLSKGYGFVSYADFESSDEAIASMHGSYFMDKEITVQYAYKKDGKGERHGDEAERQLAAEARRHNVQPTIMPMPPQLVQQPPGPSVASGANVTPTTPGYGANGTYSSMPPPPPQQHGRHPSQPLPPPPAGLPSRPPPSQAGYRGPAVMSAPPYGQMGPGGYPPQNGAPAPFPPPPGQGGFPPPPGMAPPGMAPPGMPPMGYPPPPNQRY